MLEKILLVCGLVIIGYGILGLVATWLFPSLGATRLWGKGMLTGRMPPTRFNKSLMCLWAVFFGAYIAATVAEFRPWNFVFAGAFVACAVTGIFIRMRVADA